MIHWWTKTNCHFVKLNFLEKVIHFWRPLIRLVALMLKCLSTNTFNHWRSYSSKLSFWPSSTNLHVSYNHDKTNYVRLHYSLKLLYKGKLLQITRKIAFDEINFGEFNPSLKVISISLRHVKFAKFAKDFLFTVS